MSSEVGLSPNTAKNILGVGSTFFSYGLREASSETAINSRRRRLLSISNTSNSSDSNATASTSSSSNSNATADNDRLISAAVKELTETTNVVLTKITDTMLAGKQLFRTNRVQTTSRFVLKYRMSAISVEIRLKGQLEHSRCPIFCP